MFWTTGEYTRGEERVLEDIPVKELDAVLCKFYAEVRRKDGEEYEPDILGVMQASLDRHLKNIGRPYSILCSRPPIPAVFILSIFYPRVNIINTQ